MNRKQLTAAAIAATILAVGATQAARIPDCLHRVTTLAGTQVVDPGEFNRFPASEAVGVECELVPCSVMAGEDAETDIADAGEKPGCVRRQPSLVEKYRRVSGEDLMP